MGYYGQGAVCARGHAITGDRSRFPVEKFCSKCGASILVRCSECDTNIRGRYKADGVISFASYGPPSFCNHCGAAHPWASRKERLWHVENQLASENLDEADRLTLREAFEELTNPELPEKEQVARWEVIRSIAPDALSTTWKVAESLLTAYMKSKLGI
ncbi:MAG: DUF2321 domain-containing protein [bacterium]|nr:DUF2321 domain-containing protein [bacterium]